MSEESKNINSVNKNPPGKSFIGRLFRFFVIAVLAIIILIIGIIFFIQTDTFDKLALDFALIKINTALEPKRSTIYAESLTGNLLKGFTLNNGSVKVKDDTLLKFNSIEAKYSIWQLLNSEISVQDLILRDPQINLTKIKDKNDSLKWNLTYLLESDEIDEDTTTSEFDWVINAENVSIENGAVRILEEKNSNLPIRDIVMQKLDTFELWKLDMNDLNLNLSALYSPDIKDVNIKNLALKTNSDFNLNKMTLHANVDEKNNITEINDFSVITDRTDFLISAVRMDHLNPFDEVDYEKFGANNTILDLETKTFNFKDLSFFLPDLNFLDSTVALKLTAEGEYDNLNINTLNLNTPNSVYAFSGNLKNLTNPSKLYFDITGKNIEIDPRDTKIVLPGLDIPDYSYLGKVYIPLLTYKGEADKFNSDFELRSSAGNASGNVFLDFTQDVMRYKGDISTTNFNIGKIVKDKTLESSISGDFLVDATGVDYKTMSGKLTYSLNRTKFYGQNISRSAGHLEFSRGNVNLNLSYDSDALRTKLAGKINISNPKNISYNLKGTASGLNIASFTKDNSLKSNLNFDFDVHGRGFDPDNITGNFKLNMSPSTFAEYNIPATPLDVEIDQNGNIKKISMKSDFADILLDGSFNIDNLAAVIGNNVDKIKYELDNMSILDSGEIIQTVNKTFTAVCTNLNLKYSINIKDLAPVSSFTGDDTINFKGTFDGDLNDSCGLFTLNAAGVITDFSYGDSVFITKNALLNIHVKNDVTGYKLAKLNADIDFLSDKLIVGKLPLDSTQMNLTFFENENKTTLWTQQDSTLKLFTQFSFRDSSTVSFDSLALSYEKFLVTNNNDLLVKYNSIDTSHQYIEFKQFIINSLNQKLSVTGSYSLTDTSNLTLSAANIDLSTYKKLFSEDDDTTNMISGKIRYLDLNFRGTLEKPNLNLTATSEVLRVGSTRIGRLDADIKYNDYNLESNTVFYNENNTGNFSLKGNLPSVITFGSEEIDSVQRMAILAGKPVNLNAVANNFQLRVFQQLIPYTSNLSGILTGKISLSGTSEKPQLAGKMDVNSGKFLVTLNKIRYDFYAKLATRNENLIIEDSRISIPEEPTRFLSTSGRIDFTGLTFNKIDLTMDGNVKAFDKDNGITELGIGGDLWIGSGNPKLHLTGSDAGFDFRGNLLLIKGNVVFNPFIQQAYNLYTDDFSYGVIIDSLKSGSDKVSRVLLPSNDSIVILDNPNLNPFEKVIYASTHPGYKIIPREKSGSFFYNLYVTTSENVFLKFIVNEKTQQEFFGEIKTDLYIDNKDNYQMGARGVVTLGQNCYYKFFRKFDATGKAIFTGPIANPDLNIDAQYKGYSSSGTDITGKESLNEVVIYLKVTGKAENPQLRISVDKGGITETGSDASSDAMSFLLFGKFKDQLSFEESTSFGANVGASFLSSYVSNSLEELFPFLINTNLNYVDSQNGTVIQNTDIRFTAAVGDAIIRFGGQIFKGISNTDIVVDYPLNKLFQMQSLSNNLMFRVERIYDPFEGQNDITNTTGTRAGALIYYIIKF